MRISKFEVVRPQRSLDARDIWKKKRNKDQQLNEKNIEKEYLKKSF